MTERQRVLKEHTRREKARYKAQNAPKRRIFRMIGIVYFLILMTFIGLSPTHISVSHAYNTGFNVSFPSSEDKPTFISNEARKYDDILMGLGSMGIAIKKAGLEFGEDEAEKTKLIGLLVGIANAESTLGKNFYISYDKDHCHNWWGLKGGNMTKRTDGSYLRCFVDDTAGARTVAKTLKNYYLAEGKTTPELIANKWVGRNQTPHHKQWIINVNKYY